MVEERLNRPLLWDICLLHTNERPFIKYFMYCDFKGKEIKMTAKGKKSKSTSPYHDGFIGKQFKGKKLELKNIVKFKAVNGNLPVYDENFIKSLNGDTSYFYSIVHAVQNGWEAFPESLKTKIIGHAHKGR